MRRSRRPPLPSLGAVLKAQESGGRLHRYRSNLYALCTEILGYDKLSPTFHGPMLAEWDRLDAARFMALRGGKHLPVSDDLNIWPRDHIKTWCQRARVIRYYLYDPTATVTGWHSVEEVMQESAVAIGKTLQTNKELRRLFPDGVLPSLMAKKFVTANGFQLRSNRIGDAPSFRAWGAGSEATGGHSLIGWLDDVNAYNDLVDSQFPKKRQWYQATVCNVVRAVGWKDGIGTRWDRDDTWAYLMTLPGWRVTVRAALETDGKPDYAGKPVYLTREQIEKKRAELGEFMFALQMMNDPSPVGEKPWAPDDCEHYISEEQAAGPGLVAVIADPAPAQLGSSSGPNEMKARSGEKNWWFIDVVKFRRRGQLTERILLDTDCSRDWSPSEGFERMARMGMHHNASVWALEKTGQATAFYTADMQRIARECGARMHEVDDRDQTKGLKSTYQGKNPRFRKLADAAKHQEILICRSAEKSIAALEMKLDQARNWRPLDAGSKNGLRFDDGADCWSYCMDPVWDWQIPSARSDGIIRTSIEALYAEHNRRTGEYGGRYVHY